MQPRLKTSKKWTAFPKEYLDQIQTVFHKNFAEKLIGNKLVVEGRIYPSEIVLRVGINEKGRLRQANFEVSMNYSPKEKDAVERIHNCIDAAASMMMDYFEPEGEGEAEFPRSWQEYPFQGKTLFLQFSTENTDLEAQANALLGEDAETLVIEEDSDDALARAEIDPTLSDDAEEGFPEEEEEEEEDEEAPETEKPSGPKMFGGRKTKKKGELH